jgi:hypothetical protein
VCSDENLRAALNNMGINGNALEGILDKVKNRHYQVIYLMVLVPFSSLLSFDLLNQLMHETCS